MVLSNRRMANPEICLQCLEGHSPRVLLPETDSELCRNRCQTSCVDWKRGVQDDGCRTKVFPCHQTGYQGLSTSRHPSQQSTLVDRNRCEQSRHLWDFIPTAGRQDMENGGLYFHETLQCPTQLRCLQLRNVSHNPSSRGMATLPLWTRV